MFSCDLIALAAAEKKLCKRHGELASADALGMATAEELQELLAIRKQLDALDDARRALTNDLKSDRARWS